MVCGEMNGGKKGLKIFFSHSSANGYKSLYNILKELGRRERIDFILPHEAEVRNTKEEIASCNAFVAEVSLPSTGSGIEMGWANCNNIPIIAIHRKDAKPSSSISLIANSIVSYSDMNGLSDMLLNAIHNVMGKGKTSD